MKTIFISSVLGLAALCSVAGLQGRPALNVSKAAGTNSVRLTWADTNAGFGVQYNTNLSTTNWIPAFSAISTNGLYELNDPLLDGSRYYRLIQCGYDGPPTLPDGAIFFASGQPITVIAEPPVDDYTFACVVQLDHGDLQPDGTVSGNPETLDGSQIIDPKTCGTGTLSYQWVVQDSNYNTMNRQGIVGDSTPVLTIARNTLVDGEYATQLTVTSQPDGLQTVFSIDLTVTQSTLDNTEQAACQAATNACSTCDCTTRAALPRP